MSYAKKILLGITTVIGGLLLSPPIYATGVEPIGKNLEFNNTEHCDSPLLKQFGKIDREQTVVIEGKINPLYCNTSNYNMWVSEEQNHWEFVGDNNGRYGRVRR